MKPIRIDSHQHFWSMNRGDYDWLTESLAPIYRDFLPIDLMGFLKQNQISKTILVQAAPTIAETHYLLELAEKTEFVAGVVGWVDFESENACDELKLLSQNPWFKGVRPMIQDIAADDWMLDPKLDSVFQTLIELELSFDALVLPKHLPNLLLLIKRYPNLKIVVDHAAKPNITENEFSVWSSYMASIAENDNVYCKLSGLVTEAPRYSETSVFQPYVTLLCESFGSERLMWGSDWPVLNLSSCNYSHWLEMSHYLLKKAKMSDTDIQQIMGTNAADFYRVRL